MDTHKIVAGLKELALHLGRKLDKLFDATERSQGEMRIDLTSAAVEKLQDEKHIKIDKILDAIKGLSETEAKTGLNDLKLAMSDAEKGFGAVSEMNPKLKAITTAIEKHITETKKLFSGDKQTHKLLGRVEKAISNIKLEATDIDLSGIDDLDDRLKMILKELKLNKNKGVEGKLDTIITYLKAFKVVIPQTFKLDTEQLRSIRSSGGGVGSPSAMAARGATTSNVAIVNANTEYSYTFPANTVGFQIKLRSTNKAFLHSWQTGKMPTSGDGLAYQTDPIYSSREAEGLDFSGVKIFFQCTTGSQVMEIDVYTA